MAKSDIVSKRAIRVESIQEWCATGYASAIVQGNLAPDIHRIKPDNVPPMQPVLNRETFDGIARKTQ